MSTERKKPTIEVEAPIHGDRKPAPLSPLLGTIGLHSQEPNTPNSERFHKEHATFKVPSTTVVQAWNHLQGRKGNSHQRALSGDDVNSKHFAFGAILNEIVTAKRSVQDKDADLQLAAEIGQTLLEKNAREHEVSVELQRAANEKDEQIAYLHTQLEAQRARMEELRNENLQLIHMDKSAGSELDDLDSFPIAEFLKAELDEAGYTDEDGKVIEATGIVAQDLVVFRRKLRRERKQAQVAKGLYEEARATHADEKQELMEKFKVMKAAADASDELRDRNAELKRQVDELSEQVRSLNIQHMAAMKRRRETTDAAIASEKREQEQLRRDKAAAEQTIRRLRTELDTVQREAAQMQDARAKGQVSEEMKLLSTENADLKKRLRTAEELKMQSDSRVQDLEKKLATFKDVATQLQDQSDDVKSKVARAREEAARALKEKEQLENQIAGLERDLENAVEESMNSPSPSFNSHDDDRIKKIKEEKARLEVQMMVLQSKDKNRQEELRRKEAELRATKELANRLQQEHAQLEAKFAEVEAQEKLKFQKHHETITKITNQLRILMQEYSKKKQESAQLQSELEKFKNAMEGLDSLKNAKSKYKDMGKKMLQAMKQMDGEMKTVVKKLEDAQKENKELQKENRKLSRKNEDLQKEMESTEKQMNKLMRICITGTVAQ